MDSSDLPMGGQSSRREVHGPRPTPLKVRKDSYKIKKPPIAPPMPQPAAAPPPQVRRPIIIYTLSPKVIHTTPSDFMSVVQRLTGASAAAAAASSGYANVASDASVLSPRVEATGEVFSPAARLATFEKTAQAAHASSSERLMKNELKLLADDLLGIDGGGGMSTLDPPAGLFPGILSPVPSSLPCISPNLFTSSTEQNQINFFNELSPAIHSNKSFMGINSFLPSPSNFLSSGIVPSPVAYWDLFNQYQDS